MQKETDVQKFKKTKETDFAFGTEGFVEVARKSEKHIFTEKHFADAKVFFESYDPAAIPDDRYAGTVAKKPKLPSKSVLKAIWNEFVERERFSYINANDTISIDDIIRIGIDKFVITNGWTRKSEVAAWHNNRVRIGVCPHCKDQFVPLMFQTNYGLCRNCVPKYSSEAIRKYLEFVASTNKRYENAMNDLLMDFFILFYSKEDFRVLFLEGSDFAQKYKEKEFEVAEWLRKQQTANLESQGVILDAEGEEV